VAAPAFAQTGQGGQAGGPPVAMQLAFPLLLVGIFYVLLLRPEQKRRREHESLLANIKRNDQVVMASGIHGRVLATGDKVLTVEIAPRVQVTVDRSAVQRVERGGAGAEPREKEQKS
jgi:preprotein translocase subunit YajC